jgi:hypothetical protein
VFTGVPLVCHRFTRTGQTTVRVQAVVLLAGSYLMGVVLLAAMAALDWLLVTRLFTVRVAWFEHRVVGPGLVLPEAWEKDMDDALDAAVADAPDTTPLRALLAGGHRRPT